jgi:hypothetical protein
MDPSPFSATAAQARGFDDVLNPTSSFKAPDPPSNSEISGENLVFLSSTKWF